MTDTLQDISDEEALLRRIACRPNMIKQDGGVTRPTSAAFKPAPEDDGVSVDRRALLSDPTAPTSVLDEYPEHGLVEISARAVRAEALDVRPDPLPGNRAHANIVGWASMTKPDQKRAQRQLALAAAWIRQPNLAA